MWIRSHQGTWTIPYPQNLAVNAKRFVLSTQVETASSERTAETHTPLAAHLQVGRPRHRGTGKGGEKPPSGSVAVSVATSILRPSVPRTGPSSVALAASNYDLGPGENYRSWLLDTGCKYDLATRGSIPHHQVDSIFTAPMPMLLAIASDLAQGDKVVSQQTGELGEVAEPSVLDSTPDVLSIGRRCVEDGYRFVFGNHIHSTLQLLPTKGE